MTYHIPDIPYKSVNKLELEKRLSAIGTILNPKSEVAKELGLNNIEREGAEAAFAAETLMVKRRGSATNHTISTEDIRRCPDVLDGHFEVTGEIKKPGYPEFKHAAMAVIIEAFKDTPGLHRDEVANHKGWRGAVRLLGDVIVKGCTELDLNEYVPVAKKAATRIKEPKVDIAR